jgi:hypothetical protein
MGKPFELVVSDVVSELDRNSTVRVGEWVNGPDGARELDVTVEGTAGGKQRRVQIECRDYNPERRPIGIAAIDALESKHRDVGVDLSILCSNAGFSTDAIRKAKRVGVGLVGVLREDDPRIRYKVVDEIYLRKIDYLPGRATVSYDFVGALPPQGSMRADEVLYNGKPVEHWLTHRAVEFVTLNPIVKGVHSLSFRFKFPVMFDMPTGRWPAKSIRTQFEISGGWFAQRVEIDATSGLYDWIRRTIRMAAKPGRIAYKNVNFQSMGDPISAPPDLDLKNPTVPQDEGVSIWILNVGGVNMSKTAPALGRYVVNDDLRLKRSVALDDCIS